MKKQIMIVEDDVNFRYFLTHVVPWKQYGYEIAAVAVNGKQALEMVRAHPIDIVITDISMPIMNGSELTKCLRKMSKHMTIIALSAYENFNYVKDTLVAGADDYLLKQNMTEDNVIEEVQRIEGKKKQDELENRKTEEQDKETWHNLITQNIYPSKEAEEQIQLLLGKSDILLVWTAFHSGEKTGVQHFLNMQPSSDLLYYELHEGEGILLWSSGGVKSGAEIYQKLYSFLNSFEISAQTKLLFIIGDICTSVRDVGKSYEKLKSGIDIAPYLVPKAYRLDEIGQVLADRQKKYIFNPSKELENTDREDTSKIYETLRSKLLKYMPGKQELLFSLKNTYEWCMADYKMSSEEYLAFLSDMEKMHSLEEKISYLEEYTFQQESRRNALIKNDVIREVDKYIRMHYEETDLQLTDIAEAVNLSSNYLSNLFSAVMGENLTRYINEVRIEEAKRLLCSTNLKVYEVSRRVGFNNPSYFSTVFKKITGTAVSEYKKNENSVKNESFR